MNRKCTKTQMTTTEGQDANADELNSPSVGSLPDQTNDLGAYQ